MAVCPRRGIDRNGRSSPGTSNRLVPDELEGFGVIVPNATGKASGARADRQGCGATHLLVPPAHSAATRETSMDLWPRFGARGQERNNPPTP
jgi:hypothetical protein